MGDVGVRADLGPRIRDGESVQGDAIHPHVGGAWTSRLWASGQHIDPCTFLTLTGLLLIYATKERLAVSRLYLTAAKAGEARYIRMQVEIFTEGLEYPARGHIVADYFSLRSTKHQLVHPILPNTCLKKTRASDLRQW